MLKSAVNLKPGDIVRPRGNKSGWQWAKVEGVASDPDGYYFVICEWLAGGTHVWHVESDQLFRVLREGK